MPATERREVSPVFVAVGAVEAGVRLLVRQARGDLAVAPIPPIAVLGRSTDNRAERRKAARILKRRDRS